MSKAFTKDGDEQEERELPDQPDPLPKGTKNYITPKGAERLRTELKQLLDVERPAIVKIVTWAASLGDRSENADYIYNKRKLREIDRRIRFLMKRLESAEIIDPSTQRSEVVVFGATVQIRDSEGRERVYHIVGVDETDGRAGKISWISPIGRALLRKKVGEIVLIQMPKGEEELEILAIRYESIPG